MKWMDGSTKQSATEPYLGRRLGLGGRSSRPGGGGREVVAEADGRRAERGQRHLADPPTVVLRVHEAEVVRDLTLRAFK